MESDSYEKVITASNYEVIPLDLRTNVRFIHRWTTCLLTGDAVEILYLQEGELKVNTRFRNLRFGQCTLIQPNKVHSTFVSNKDCISDSLLFLEKFVPDAAQLTFQLEDKLLRQNGTDKKKYK